MYYWISYDIQNDGVRTKLSKNLEKLGAIRIQKSVFLADGSLKTWQDIVDYLAKVTLNPKEVDNVVIMAVEEHQLKVCVCLGRNESLEELKNPPKIVLF